MTEEEEGIGTPKIKRLGGKLKARSKRKKVKEGKEEKLKGETGPGHHQTNIREYFTVYSKIVRKECRKSPETLGALRKDPTTTTSTAGHHHKEGRDLDGNKGVKKKLKYLEEELTAGSDGSRGPPKARL